MTIGGFFGSAKTVDESLAGLDQSLARLRDYGVAPIPQWPQPDPAAPIVSPSGQPRARVVPRKSGKRKRIARHAALR